MPQSGQEMLDESIALCNQIADGLGAQNPAWENSITEIVEKFNEISGTFFFKTMPAIPATRATLRDANALLETKQAGDWAKFGTDIATLIASSQSLIEKAGMKGTTLT
jgi:hypothetical protein